MTNRKVAYIVKNQTPLVFPSSETVGHACREMCDAGVGSVLVEDAEGRLAGIFTGRDAVRLMATGGTPADVRLVDAMTRNPVAITVRSSAIDAIRCMCEGGFRHVPVLDAGRVCGVVSRGDFRGMEFETFEWPKGRTSPEREVSQIIGAGKPLRLVSAETVQAACRAMAGQNVGSALVVDADERLVGIFTGRDAVRCIATGRGPTTPLTEAMTRNPMTITPKSLAIDALRAMCEGGFRHLPVVEDGTIVGIVSRNDFTGVEIDHLDQEEHLKECIW